MRRKYEARMNNSIKIHCRLVNLEELWVVEILGVGTIAAHNHRHGFFEVLHLVSQAVQIEIVGDVFLVNLCEELVPLQVTEPLNPSIATLAVVFVVHCCIS